MIRLGLCLSLILSIPGPSAWGQAAALGRGSSAPGVTALPFLVAPVSPGLALGSSLPLASTLSPSLSPRLAPLPLAAPVYAAALALPAPSAASVGSAVSVARVIPVAPVALAALPMPLLAAAAQTGLSEAPEAATPEPAKSPAAADPSAFFDGARAFLSIPGQAPREVALSEIEGVLAADDSARGALSRKGRVLIVLAKGAPVVDALAARAALAIPASSSPRLGSTTMAISSLRSG